VTHFHRVRGAAQVRIVHEIPAPCRIQAASRPRRNPVSRNQAHLILERSFRACSQTSRGKAGNELTENFDSEGIVQPGFGEEGKLAA